MRLDPAEANGAGGHRPVGPQWVRYDDLAPVALMAGDVDAVREFAVTTLGDLTEGSARNVMLRETFRTFLTYHRSHAATQPRSHAATQPRSHAATQPRSHAATQPRQRP